MGASLTYITMLSDAAKDEERVGPAQLERIHQTARELTRSMDEIVWAVNPKHDTLESLTVYFTRFAHDFLSAANIRCRFDLPILAEELSLRAEVRHNLFLAYKETLHNIVSHAAATEVGVSLQLKEHRIVLAVSDNGQGFDLNGRAEGSMPKPDRIAQGEGVDNLRRRLADIRGELKIQTAPGRGTTFTFTVPVQG